MIATQSLNEKLSPGTRILLVDDSALQAKALIKLFKELGYENLVVCSDPFQALEVITKEQIQVVFCDWNMPGCSGLELLAEIRKDTRYRSLPFVLVTANAQKEQVIQALRSGVKDYVVKPLSREILEKKLEEVAVQCAGYKNAPQS